MEETETLSWLRLSRTERVGPATFRRLLSQWGSARVALEALPDMVRRGGSGKPLTSLSPSEAQRIIAATEQLGGAVVCLPDAAYPAMLRSAEDAPPVLFAAGPLRLEHRHVVGVVGARNASLNGQKFTKMLAEQLGQHNIVVASGLAAGIDTAAHHGALTKGTIAVLGCGLDRFYPAENKKLQEKIMAEGLLLSEYPPGTAPAARHFPQRNRIIAGMSHAVAVVEASLQSGSLNTARLAGEYGREVFAVPGSPLDPRCQGTNKLLRDGAHFLENAADIFPVLPRLDNRQLFEQRSALPYLDTVTVPDDAALRTAQASVLTALSATAVTLDELYQAVCLPQGLVQWVLLEMELAGRIERSPGGTISRLF
jgi:DNA processing protein